MKRFFLLKRNDSIPDYRKFLLWLTIISIVPFSYNPLNAQSNERVTVSKFKVISPFWNPVIKKLIVNYIPMTVDLLENDRDGWHSLQNFVEAGKKNRGLTYNVPTPELNKKRIWSDGPVYNTFESMCWALTIDPSGDAEIEKVQQFFRNKIEKWITLFLDAQESDGYLMPQVTISGLERWKNPANINLHEDYMLGYFIECAIALHTATNGNDNRLLDAAQKSVDLWCEKIGNFPKIEFQTSHAGLKQSLVKLADLKDQLYGRGVGRKYRNLALFLYEIRGKRPNINENETDWFRGYVMRDELNSKLLNMHGHAVMGVYLLSGLAEITRTLDKTVSGDNFMYKFRSMDNLVKRLSDNLINRKMYVNATIGSSGMEEYMGEYVLPNYSYSETCATIGLMLAMNNLGLLYGKSGYADITETALYNGLLGSLDLECQNWAYCNPLKNIKDKTWRDNWERKHDHQDCCMGNISRTLLQLPTFMYSKTENAIWVNQYVGSKVVVNDVSNSDITVVQKTDYPLNGKITLVIQPEKPTVFTLYLRIPNRQISDLYQPDKYISGYRNFRLNEKKIEAEMYKGYLMIKKNWKKGDKITLEFPMQMQQIVADDLVEENRGKTALQYGPFVYAFEAADCGNRNPDDLVIDLQHKLKINNGADWLNGMTTITGQFTDKTRFAAIPFYARMNRKQADRYCVWMNFSDR